MKVEQKSIEQHCRDLLEMAIEELLVAPNDEWKDPHPQARSSGELIGVANLLRKILLGERDGRVMVRLGPPLFKLKSQQEYQRDLGRKLTEMRHHNEHPKHERREIVIVDARGRVVDHEKHAKRATADNAYPLTVYGNKVGAPYWDED